MNDKSKPYRFQFSLRTLLILMVVVSIPLVLIGYRIERVRQQKIRVKQQQGIIAPLMKYEPSIYYSNGFIWCFDFTREDLNRRMNLLKDDDLATVAKLQKLEYLYLDETQVTDGGLVHLKEMHNLRVLGLHGLPITDEGMVHIANLDRLQSLTISYTKITDEGLALLANSAKITYLHLDITAITDDGLEHLSKLRNLEMLYLRDTQVTNEGVRKLQRALPNCRIEWQFP